MFKVYLNPYLTTPIIQDFCFVVIAPNLVLQVLKKILSLDMVKNDIS